MGPILAISFWALANAQQYMIQPVVSDIPEVLHQIAVCESGDRQFEDNGSVKRGIINKKDVGKYQINEKYHLEDSKKMGYDIYTEEGNERYALYLYKMEGTAPWIASKSCWNKPVQVE